MHSEWCFFLKKKVLCVWKKKCKCQEHEMSYNITTLHYINIIYNTHIFAYFWHVIYYVTTVLDIVTVVIYTFYGKVTSFLLLFWFLIVFCIFFYEKVARKNYMYVFFKLIGFSFHTLPCTTYSLFRNKRFALNIML